VAEAGTVAARRCSFVGQDGILRGGWQTPRGPIVNRPAACQAAPQAVAFEDAELLLSALTADRKIVTLA